MSHLFWGRIHSIQWIIGAILILYALYGLFFHSSSKGIDKRWAYVYGFLKEAHYKTIMFILLGLLGIFSIYRV